MKMRGSIFIIKIKMTPMWYTAMSRNILIIIGVLIIWYIVLSNPVYIIAYYDPYTLTFQI